MRVCHNVLIFLVMDIKYLCNVLLVEFCTHIFVFVSWACMGQFLFDWCVHKVDSWYRLEPLLYIKNFFSNLDQVLLFLFMPLISFCVCVCVSITGGDIIEILHIYFFKSPLPLFHISSSHKFLVLLLILFCSIGLLVYFSDQTTLE